MPSIGGARTALIALAIGCAAGLAQPVIAQPQPSSQCVSINRRQEATSEAKCYSIEHGGVQRTFRVYAPPTRKGPTPLVMVLHGGGGSGGNMEWLTKRGFNRIADRDGAVIVYPDGIGKSWNDGRSDLKSEAVEKQVDDVGYLRALATQLAAPFAIDTKRIYATGISNGGLMSYRLACEAADVFAAVAPVAANLSVDLASRCKPARAIALAIINGTEDPLIPWDGGPVKILWSTRGEVISADATMTEWMRLDHCADAHDNAPLDAVKDDGTRVVEHFARCTDTTEVRLYEVRGGGHTWPGGEAYLGQWLVGRVSREIDANALIWRFFQQHRML